MSSIDSEEEERQEELRRTEGYKKIYQKKLFLKVFNRKIFEFDFKFPKTSYDRIIQLYGNEMILPLSFVHFSNPFEITETIRYSSRNINVRTSIQINSILDLLDNYFVYPASYEGMDEFEKLQKAPKLKTKYLKNISTKMGLPFSEMINYVALQMTEIDVKETTRIIVTIETYQLVFNLINLLHVKFPEKENFELAFYSYRKILKMAGIELDKIIPLLDIFIIENSTRQEILDSESHILLDKVSYRELRESIDEKIKDKNVDLYAGTESCERIKKPEELLLEPFREEVSNLLFSLIGEEDNENEEQENHEEENKKDDNEEEHHEEKPQEEENKENEENIHKQEIKVSEKENEESNIDNILIENITILNNTQNNEKISNQEIENNNEKKETIEIISAESISVGNKKPEKKEEDLNKNKIINQKIINENKIEDKKENENKKQQIVGSGDNTKEKKKTVQENFSKMRAIVNAKKVTRKQFKIRRAVFVKVEQ